MLRSLVEVTDLEVVSLWVHLHTALDSRVLNASHSGSWALHVDLGALAASHGRHDVIALDAVHGRQDAGEDGRVLG